MNHESMLAVLRGYEQWEADLIESDEAWSRGDGTPFIPDELWDRLLELQTMRNRALYGKEQA